MARIDSVTAPLAIVFDNGDKILAAACFEHKAGLLYLDPFWHLGTPDETAHLIRGTLRGEGPWRIANATIRVMGCQNTDPELQTVFSSWQHYLSENAQHYPPDQQIREIAEKLGALLN